MPPNTHSFSKVHVRMRNSNIQREKKIIILLPTLNSIPPSPYPEITLNTALCTFSRGKGSRVEAALCNFDKNQRTEPKSVIMSLKETELARHSVYHCFTNVCERTPQRLSTTEVRGIDQDSYEWSKQSPPSHLPPPPTHTHTHPSQPPQWCLSSKLRRH